MIADFLTFRTIQETEPAMNGILTRIPRNNCAVAPAETFEVSSLKPSEGERPPAIERVAVAHSPPHGEQSA